MNGEMEATAQVQGGIFLKTALTYIQQFINGNNLFFSQPLQWQYICYYENVVY